jgi:hypothetical protein
MLDNLDAAPQRRPECRGHRHSADRVPAALAGRFDEAGETVGMRTQQHGGEIIAPARMESAFQITAGQLIEEAGALPQGEPCR